MADKEKNQQDGQEDLESGIVTCLLYTSANCCVLPEED